MAKKQNRPFVPPFISPWLLPILGLVLSCLLFLVDQDGSTLLLLSGAIRNGLGDAPSLCLSLVDGHAGAPTGNMPPMEMITDSGTNTTDPTGDEPPTGS